MTNDFRGRLLAYQEKGDRMIIDEILWAVDFDFMANPTRRRYFNNTKRGGISIDLERSEHYIAYRIRAMRELVTRQYLGRFTDGHINEMQRLLSIIYIDLNIRFKADIYDQTDWNYFFNLTPELFAELESHMPKIKRKMHYDTLPTFLRLFDRYKKLVTEQESEKELALATIEQSIIAALEYGLQYADASKSEREIVKYVNMAFSSKFGDLELERNGLVRIQRNDRYGNRQNLHVKKHFPEDLTKVLFGKSVEDYQERLTRGQVEFVDAVMEIIHEDALNSDFEHYTCDKKGEARVSKQYVADKLGLTSTTVRKRFSRITKKV